MLRCTSRVRIVQVSGLGPVPDHANLFGPSFFVLRQITAVKVIQDLPIRLTQVCLQKHITS